jgi:hypothetical protein
MLANKNWYIATKNVTLQPTLFVYSHPTCLLHFRVWGLCTCLCKLAQQIHVRKQTSYDRKRINMQTSKGNWYAQLHHCGVHGNQAQWTANKLHTSNSWCNTQLHEWHTRSNKNVLPCCTEGCWMHPTAHMRPCEWSKSSSMEGSQGWGQTSGPHVLQCPGNIFAPPPLGKRVHGEFQLLV